MRRLVWICGLVAAGQAAGAPALKPRPDPRLIGTWLAVRIVHRGQDVTALHATKRFTFLSDGRFLNRPRPDPSKERYVADPDGGPASLDLMHDPTGPAGRSRGVYRLDGDTLTISLRGKGGTRPAHLRPDAVPRRSDEDGVTVLVLTRIRASE